MIDFPLAVLAEMSRSLFALGNDAKAGLVWSESLCIAIETKGTFIALEALVGLASLQAKQGDIEQAFVLVLIVSNHTTGVQETKDRAAHLRTELEAQLTSQQVEAATVKANRALK